MSTLICSFDGLHDNRVLRYCADFEAHTLHMDTQSETGEKVSVRFTGLLADRKSTRLNSSHIEESRMPSSA